MTLLNLILAGVSTALTSFFVSPSGNDASDGTFDSPFATISHAVEVAQTVNGPVTVYLRGGTYWLDSAVTVNDAWRLTLEAYGDEVPVLRGSAPVTTWKKVTSRAVLSKVSKEAASRLVYADLSSQGINNLGDPLESGKRPQLYCNDVEQTLARYPNEGFIYGGRALGETIIPPVANGNSGAVEGYFEYLDPRVDRWAGEKDARVGGYWFWDWSDAYYNVTSIDPRARTMRVSHDKEFRHGLRFFGLNLLCEIDASGEWYLDRETSRLYWFPPEGVDPVRQQSDITISMLESSYMLNLEDCKNVTVKGLSFSQSRGGAISVKGGASCRILDCHIENLGTLAVSVTGYGHKIDGCLIEHLSMGGVTMCGGDRKNLIHSELEMSNTMVRDYERFNRTYNGGFSGEGCGVWLHHCEITGAPSSAFSLGGNDMIAEFNYFHDVATESDDQGGFDLYLNPSMRGIVMRYNRWSDIHGGTRYGVGGIRLDDLITGVSMYGNIFERCGSVEFGAIQIHGGSENTVEDNLFFDCPMAVSFTPYGDSLWHETYGNIQNLMHKEVEIDSPKYLRRYPEIRELGKNIDVNIIRNNLLVDCDSMYFHATVPQIESNNVQMDSEGRDIMYFCRKDVLHPIGIKTIPVGEIGIKRNKWLGI